MTDDGVYSTFLPPQERYRSGRRIKGIEPRKYMEISKSPKRLSRPLFT